MAIEEVVTGINTNLYGAATGVRPATLFEQIGGGQHCPPHRRIAGMASAVKGYRLRLGRRAYADRALGEGLLRLLAS